METGPRLLSSRLRDLRMRTLALLALLAGPALAQSVTQDPTFGPDGVVWLPSAEDETLVGLELLEDDRVLLAVRSDADDSLVRLLSSGAPDPGFGTDGVVRLNDPEESIGSLALAPGGQIYVAGDAGPPTDVLLRRLLADGSPDLTFGTDGVVRTDVRGTADRASALALTPDGRVVLVGTSSRPSGGLQWDLVAARYLPDGSLDPTFGDGGRAVLDVGTRPSPFRVRVLADGRILVAGTLGGQWPSDALVLRLDPDGALDPAFGEGGITQLDYATQDYASGLAVLPDGRIVVTGSSGFEEAQNLNRARLLADGTPDPAFENGMLFLGDRQNSGADVAVLPSGHLLVVGAKYAGPDNLLRLHPDGSLDDAFGDGGVVQGTFGSNAVASAIRIQTDGKAVVGGWAGYPRTVAVARFLNVLPVAAGAEPLAPFGLSVSPNPLTGRGLATLSLPTPAPVRVVVHDVVGRRVALLHDGPLPAGTHRFRFAAPSLAPGVYAITASTPGRTATRLVAQL